MTMDFAAAHSQPTKTRTRPGSCGQGARTGRPDRSRLGFGFFAALSAALLCIGSLGCKDGTGVEPATSPNGQNVALQATVTASATGSCYLTTCLGAAKVIDGTPTSGGGLWSAADYAGTGWVQLALDQPYLLSKIRVFSYHWDATLFPSEGGVNYRVLVSSDQSTWTPVRAASLALQKTVDINWAREDIVFSPQAVRYIKVDIVGSTGVASYLWRTPILEIEAGDSNLPLQTWGAYF